VSGTDYEVPHCGAFSTEQTVKILITNLKGEEI
jgi:hypothetical protein